jgi:hypothetical protein
MTRIINKATHLPLTQLEIKLNQHIEKMNADGWELMSAAIEAVGIEELFILFWKRTVEAGEPMRDSGPTGSYGTGQS